MKLYAYATPEIPKHEGYLKVGETNGEIDARIKQQGHELNVKRERVWDDSVYTDRRGIDREFRHFLKEKGFSVQKFAESEQDAEWVKCTAVELKKAFADFKEQFFQSEQRRQELGNKFYLEIRNWYYWANSNFPDPDTALRHVVRLLFCFFLQEKELVPKELFEELFVKEHLKDKDEYRYYNAILRNLFFHCLNTPIKERGELEHKNLMKYAERIQAQFDKIPFLNGGLFNEHAGDEIPLGNRYFFSDEETHELPELGGKCKVAGIIQILSKYHYKLTLDDLLDREKYEKTVDPEFIGKVFESLLACISADSKETRRKITGSYYTPREIVDYMVSEALDAYSQDPDDLLRCKILDPACGSGAFPCGIMNEMMRRIDPNREMDRSVRYRKKLKVVREVIYGVDIQPVAVQISQLRLFLSLIQEIVPTKRKEDNYGTEPLPNLDTKFVCADTLIGLQMRNKYGQEKIEQPIVQEAIKQLLMIRRQHFAESHAQQKQFLRTLDESSRKMLSLALIDEGIYTHAMAKKIATWDPYNPSHSASFFDPLWMFGIATFDIVIGNPPYISAPTMVATNPEGRQAIIDSGRFHTLYQKWDMYIPFMEYGLQVLEENGVLTMIVPYPLTNQVYAKMIREMIISKYNLIEIADLSGTKIFESATISNCIPLIRKSPPGDGCFISHIDEKKKITRSFTQDYSDLVQDEKTAVWNLTREKRETSRHAEMSVLGDFCYISVGMVLNADEKTAKGEFVKTDLISETADAIHCRKYIEAKDIERYRVKRVRYLEYDTPRCPDQLRRPTFRELYNVPKLVMNCLGTINATLDEKEKFLHNHSLYCAILWNNLQGIRNKSILASVKRYSRYSRKKMEAYSERVDLRYLLGVLNSKYASVLLSNLRGGDYHIYPEHLRNMPIPLVSMSRQQPVIDLVKKILSEKKRNSAAKTVELEQKIDALVYKLYGLSKEEIAAIENARQTQ